MSSGEDISESGETFITSLIHVKAETLRHREDSTNLENDKVKSDADESLCNIESKDAMEVDVEDFVTQDFNRGPSYVLKRFKDV